MSSLSNISSLISFFSKKRFKFVPYFLPSFESLKVEQQLPGDVDAHEVEGFIKPIHKLGFINILLGFEFSAHFHAIHSFVTQGYMHIFPPINIIEGCKDPG